jgi:hypothetical protein
MENLFTGTYGALAKKNAQTTPSVDGASIFLELLIILFLQVIKNKFFQKKSPCPMIEDRRIFGA